MTIANTLHDYIYLKLTENHLLPDCAEAIAQSKNVQLLFVQTLDQFFHGFFQPTLEIFTRYQVSSYYLELEMFAAVKSVITLDQASSSQIDLLETTLLKELSKTYRLSYCFFRTLNLIAHSKYILSKPPRRYLLDLIFPQEKALCTFADVHALVVFFDPQPMIHRSQQLDLKPPTPNTTSKKDGSLTN